MRKSAMFFAGLSMLAAVGCSTNATETTHTATLNAGQEVPAPTSTADGSNTATGSMTLTSDGVNVASYRLTVNGLRGITAAHIHTTNAGVGPTATAPVVVFLYDGPTTDATSLFTGNLGCSPPATQCTNIFNQATITASNGAVNFATLIGNIRNRLAYVNVHTTANTAGAIRGNF